MFHKTSDFISTGQSIPIPNSEPFSHLRCRNDSQKYLNVYIFIYLTRDLIKLYISNKLLIGYKEVFYILYSVIFKKRLSFFKLKKVQMVKSECFITLRNMHIFKGNVKLKEFNVKKIVESRWTVLHYG